MICLEIVCVCARARALARGLERNGESKNGKRLCVSVLSFEEETREDVGTNVQDLTTQIWISILVDTCGKQISTESPMRGTEKKKIKNLYRQLTSTKTYYKNTTILWHTEQQETKQSNARHNFESEVLSFNTE